MEISRTRNDRHRVLRTGAMVLLILIWALFLFAGVHGASGEQGGKKGWVATDSYRVINFAALGIVVFAILRKPATRALSLRVRDIRNQLDELEEKKLKAEEGLAQYNERLAFLDKEADAAVEKCVQQGHEAREKILQVAAAAAEKLEDQAYRRIEREFGQSKVRLQSEIFERALAMVEEKISSNITADDRDKRVDDYREKVVAR